jgi:acyl-CoA synthetase (AMP-forming)/AMP-acid ligase II
MAHLPAEGDTLAAALATALAAAPAAAAVGSYRGPSRIAWLSRGRLLESARAHAQALGAAGIVRGEACLIAPVEDGELDTAALIVGCILAGCAPLTVPAVDAGGNIADVLARCLAITRSRLVVVASHDAAKADRSMAGLRATGAATEVLDLARLAAPGLRVGGEPAAHDGCRLMQLTSGTTGTSRVCMWSEAGILAAVRGITAAMQVAPGDVLFTWSGLHHTVGLLNNLMLGLCGQVPAVFMSAQTFARAPLLWLRGMAETAATITSAPNFGFKLAADSARADEVASLDLSKVRAFWNTGERVAFATCERFHEAFSACGLRKSALRANFGSAENSGGATFSDVGPSPLIFETVDRDKLQHEGEAVPVPGEAARSMSCVTIASVGAPWPGLRLHIRDEAGRPCADGKVGEIALETPSRFLGYCNDAEATAAVLDGGMLLTGDLGYRRRGQLFWIGRKQECIVIRGRKIDPGELAPALDEVAGLRPGAYVAFGVDEEQTGTQRAVVAVELDGSGRDPALVVRDIRRSVLRAVGIGAEILALPAGTLQTTISGKRRHRYYKGLYLRGELQPLRAGAGDVAGRGP